MATIIYIKETKQTVSAMKGLIDYCCQEKKTYDTTYKNSINQHKVYNQKAREGSGL